MGSFWRRLFFFVHARTLLAPVVRPIALSVGAVLAMAIAVPLYVSLIRRLGGDDTDVLTEVSRSLGGSGSELGQSGVGGCALGMCPAFLVLIPLVFKLATQYRVRLGVKPVQKALDGLVSPESRYVLLLRPFGADGFIHLRVPSYADPKLLSRWSGAKWWRESSTVEAILSQTAQVMLGVPTVALVAPRQVVLPPGPRYLKASDDWKGDVERLLQQALFVVVVLPPGRAFTQSVRWEIEQCRRLGLLGRLLLVAPPPGMRGRRAARKALEELLPGHAGVLDRLLAARLEPSGAVKVWPAEEWVDVSAETYEDLFVEALRRLPTHSAEGSSGGVSPSGAASGA